MNRHRARRIYLSFVLFLFILPTFAQGLKVGQPMPEIKFTKLINTEQQELSLSSLKGKNVILYTWAVYCAPCIEKFPMLNKLRDENRDNLEIILLSGDEYNRVVRIFDNQQSIGKNITLTQAVLSKEDWKLLALSKEDGFGGSIWIDQEGVYQGAAEIDDENVAHFIHYGKPKALKFYNYAKAVKNFVPVDDTKRQENFTALKTYNNDRPLLFAQEGTNIRSGSIFTAYNPNYPDRRPIVVVMKEGKPIGLRMVNVPHSTTYEKANIVAYDVDEETRVLKSKKSRKSKFSFNNPRMRKAMSSTRLNRDSLLYTKGICYELILPANVTTDIPTLLTYMRNDLDRYFGFSSTIEYQKCLSLVRTGDNDNQTVSSQSITEQDNYSVTIRNGSIDYLTTAIYYYLKLSKDHSYPYVFNHTGIEYNVDVELVADMTDLQSIRKALQKFGLDLIETDAIGEVCIIKD